MLVTPHAGEFGRLVAELDDPPDPAADRVGAARSAAAALGVTVLLKGNATVVAAPDGRVLVHPAGSSWLATAGSGDVLSGIAGALLAAGLEPFDAAGAAAFVHARAAELGAGTPDSPGAPVPASHVQAAIPDAIRSVRAEARR
jgi:NAD(P)H-hydrate repair Nnr-like enzyme with NAD(P)H-hydrate dehydratase domain